ncbi:hypothetical protein [Microvirga arabica]|uniref:hypothetical protein n=1 Tax=Microvirga arabica TaxID=1128671 RepID=UPI00193A7469|nr:hypothetical protein [Microvirga arabica]MBM1170096.1 hypothetical protein [Microvirga arabica]
MQAAPVAFGIAAALHSTIENTKAERAAWRADILQGISEQRAADAVCRLGHALAEAHRREAALRQELKAMKLRALAAEGKLARVVGQH